MIYTIIEERKMKDVESKLISALIRDSRRGDREIARNLGVSQPTVTRLRTKLEKEGYIQEYTMLPDLRKIGFEIMAFTFYRVKNPLLPQQVKEIKGNILMGAQRNPTAVIMALGGMGGLDADRVIVSFHRNFSDYTLFLRETRSIPHIAVADSRSFLVDLGSDSHFFPLSFSHLADYIFNGTERSEKNEQGEAHV